MPYNFTTNVLYYCEHEMKNKPRIRVWQANWLHDQFEILSYEEFEELKTQREMIYVDTEDDEEEEEE